MEKQLENPIIRKIQIEDPAKVVADFGRYIRKRRKELGYTQVLLAELTGHGQYYISQLETGSRKMISLWTMAQILAALESTISFVPEDEELNSQENHGTGQEHQQM